MAPQRMTMAYLLTVMNIQAFWYRGYRLFQASVVELQQAISLI